MVVDGGLCNCCPFLLGRCKQVRYARMVMRGKELYGQGTEFSVHKRNILPLALPIGSKTPPKHTLPYLKYLGSVPYKLRYFRLIYTKATIADRLGIGTWSVAGVVIAPLINLIPSSLHPYRI